MAITVGIIALTMIGVKNLEPCLYPNNVMGGMDKRRICRLANARAINRLSHSLKLKAKPRDTINITIRIFVMESVICY